MGMMGGLSTLKRKFGMGPDPDPSVSVTDNNFGNFADYGESAEVSMEKILAYLKRDVQFRLAVMTYTAESAGNGFFNTADESTPTGKKSLEIVNDFCEDWDLDKLNILTAIEGWATGNSFDHYTGTRDAPFSAIYKIPIETMCESNEMRLARLMLMSSWHQTVIIQIFRLRWSDTFNFSI